VDSSLPRGGIFLFRGWGGNVFRENYSLGQNSEGAWQEITFTPGSLVMSLCRTEHLVHMEEGKGTSFRENLRWFGEINASTFIGREERHPSFRKRPADRAKGGGGTVFFPQEETLTLTPCRRRRERYRCAHRGKKTGRVSRRQGREKKPGVLSVRGGRKTTAHLFSYLRKRNESCGKARSSGQKKETASSEKGALLHYRKRPIWYTLQRGGECRLLELRKGDGLAGIEW